MGERSIGRNRLIKRIIFLCIPAILVAGLLGFLLYFGYIWPVNPSTREYPVRGIDVSEHQGEIDWQAVSRAGVDFAFIKASEGKDHKDSRFSRNWADSAAAGVVRSAYHFFTFKSSGLDQADNFIACVPYDPESLPPTVDVEFGGNSKDIPEPDVFRKELEDFIGRLKASYYKTPILYVAYDSYEKYISGHFDDCSIWIRDLFRPPSLRDGREWTFWQYNCRARVSGIDGYVDLNVFKGDEDRLEEFTAGSP